MCVPGRRNRRPVTQVFHLHERGADADVGTHLSRVGRPEECEMTAEADVAEMESRLVPQLLNSRNAGHRPVTDEEVTH